MDYKREQVKNILDRCLKECAVFCYNNRFSPSVHKMASGDLFTRLRRHFMTNLNMDVIDRDNISAVYVDPGGQILFVDFVDKNYSSYENKKLMGILRDSLEELNPNFNIHKLDAQLSGIIESVNNFKTA